MRSIASGAAGSLSSQGTPLRFFSQRQDLCQDLLVAYPQSELAYASGLAAKSVREIGTASG